MKNKKYELGRSISLVIALALSVATANLTYGAESCAKLDQVVGANCKDLKVQLDISACSGEKAHHKLTAVTCKANQASFSTKGHQSEFSGELTATEGWGKVVWNLTDSGLTMTEIQKPVAKKATVNRTIATQGATSLPPVKVENAPSPTPVVEIPSTAVAGAPAPAPAPSPSTTPPLVLSGLVDGYYQTNFYSPGAVTPATGSAVTLANGQTKLRNYDNFANQMTLNLAELEVKTTGTEASFLVDLDFGNVADENTPVGSGANGQFSDEVSKHIGQAYVTYTPEWAPGLTFDFGKMATFVGYEVIKSRDNWQYSLSMLFSYGIPLWHTGLHVGYALFGGKLTLNGYVLNNWNSIYTSNSGKTYGAQLKYSPSDQFTVIYNLITGPEQVGNNSNMKTVHNLNAVYVANPTVSVAEDLIAGQEANAAYGGTSTAHWEAGDVYLKLQARSWLWFSPRLEIYKDNQGYTTGVGVPATFLGYTMTTGFDLHQGLELRLEFRHDNASGVSPYLGQGGLVSLPVQNTLTSALIYSF